MSSSLNCGKRSRFAALMASTCACACSSVAPGFSRPTWYQLFECRRSSDLSSAVNASGIQNRASGSENSKLSGMTPTMV